MPTHNTYRYTLGVVFDGVGSDTSETGGIAWAYGAAPTGTSDYEWKANHLARLPESVDTAVNPLSGGYSTSAFDFELSMNDDVATTFLHQSTEPSIKLSAAIDDSQTTIAIADLSGTAYGVASGSVVWVGDECILIGTNAGGGSHTGCTRGFWGTYAQTHIDDTYVHQSVNYWRFRGVRLVVHDRDTDTERTIWRGWTDSMGTSPDGTTLNIQCTEILQSLMGALVNRGAPNAAKRNPPAIFTAGGRVRVNGGDIPRTTNNAGKTAVDHTQWFQVEDVLFDASFTASTGRTTFSTGAARWNSQDAVDLEELNGGGMPARVEESYEVFVVDGESTASKSSTGDLTNPFHPIEIAMALLTSTRSTTVNVGAQAWDALGGEWGLGIPLDMFDLDGIEALITETIDTKIGRLLLGWGGEAVNVMDVVIEKLLKPYGFYISVTTEGTISFKRLALFGILDYNTSISVTTNALPTQLQWDAARSNSVQQVIAEVGELPWRDPDMLNVVGRDDTRTDSLRSALFGEKTTYSLDFSTQADEEDVRSIAIDRLKYAYWAMPRLTITVDDPTIAGADYDLGALVTPAIDTQKGWLVSNDGTREDATGTTLIDSKYSGIIVGRTMHLPNMTYTLQLLLTNYRQGGAVYIRPPAAVVVSIGGGAGDEVTVEANTFHSQAADASKFKHSGTDYVAFYRPDGQLREAGFSISSTPVGNVITLNTAPTLVVAGDIMRIDSYDSSTPSDYNYAADANGQLGAANDSGRRYA